MESALLVPVTSSADFSYWRKWIITFLLPNHLAFFVFSLITMFIFLNKSVYLQNKKYDNNK